MQPSTDTSTLLRRALAGQNLELDAGAYRLHDLTQIALVLRPDARLAIRHAGHMTPLERASIASVGRGQVLFL